VTDASLVVVAYRKPQALGRLLDSVGDAVPVVVVNVGNDPAVAAVASDRGVAGSVSIANRGYAAGVNAGIGALSDSTGVVVISNDDVVFLGDAIDELVGHVGADPRSVAVPAILDSEGTRQRTISPRLTLLSLLLEWAILPDAPPRMLNRCRRVVKWRLPEHAEVVPGATGAVVAGHRSLMRECPLPDAYFMYWEEREWFNRLGDLGARVTYLPSAKVMHLGGRSDLRPEKQVLLVENAVMCVRRLYGRLAAILSWPIVLLWQLRLLGQSLVLWAARKATRHELAVRFVGLGVSVRSLRCVRWTSRPV
jgi:N-acetylglucosaminyl-diphospho-decaprenol L-rhamnosyltransferase